MDKETLRKAMELETDIENLNAIISVRKKDNHRIAIASPTRNYSISYRTQDAIIEFLKEKLEQYEKEFEEL